MLNLLFCVFFIAALLNGFVFGGALFWSLLAALLAAAFVALRLLFAKKLKPPLLRLLSILGVAVLLCIGLWSGMQTDKSGLLAYEHAMGGISGQLGDSNYIKAGEALATLEKDYGAVDATQLQKARIATGKKEYDAAASYLSMVLNKQSKAYYAIFGELYLAQAKYAEAQGVYVEAARTWPLWSEAQRVAGTQAVCNKNYAIGEYFLLRAFEQMPYDPIPLYYLGVIRYEQGVFTQAESYFAEAQALGLDKELSSYVAWYRQQIGGKQP